jgi:hypothetical protein
VMKDKTEVKDMGWPRDHRRSDPGPISGLWKTDAPGKVDRVRSGLFRCLDAGVGSARTWYDACVGPEIA